LLRSAAGVQRSAACGRVLRRRATVFLCRFSGCPEFPDQTRLSHKEIVEGMRALRQRVKPDDMNVKQMITEGRRF
jgi:hypothetical protein